jgi:hypothetical protein|tara:strand:- start:273 stop:503 length:231 start_codon:yes stop_codon:yes gene_type:complete
MNNQHLAEELSDFTFEIARLSIDCSINESDLAILELCHRELDRISENMLEAEREHQDLAQRYKDDLVAYRAAVGLT